MNASKTLTRSRYDKILGGVAGGLAQYLEMDSAIVRFLFILVTLVFGSGIWVYLILWIILPYEPIRPIWNNAAESGTEAHTGQPAADMSQPVNHPPVKMRKDSNLVIGGILIILGVLFLLGELIPYFDFGKLWPVILIIVGGVLLYNYYKSSHSKTDNNQ